MNFTKYATAAAFLATAVYASGINDDSTDGKKSSTWSGHFSDYKWAYGSVLAVVACGGIYMAVRKPAEADL